jgi:transcriptional regulator with XRE-family HTH domain
VPKRPMTAGKERRYAEFRRLIVEERENAGLTQAELGEKLDPPRPQSYIGKIEIGTRRIDALEYWDIAKAVGYDPCGLLNKLESSLAKQQTSTDGPATRARGKNSRE